MPKNDHNWLLLIFLHHIFLCQLLNTNIIKWKIYFQGNHDNGAIDTNESQLGIEDGLIPKVKPDPDEVEENQTQDVEVMNTPITQIKIK